MSLNTKALNVLVAIVPTFIASLPLAPAREELKAIPNHESETVLRTNNATTNLRFEAQRLLDPIPENHTTHELSKTIHREATEALEEVFHLFLTCLDNVTDSCELHEMTSALETFRDELAVPPVPALGYTSVASDRIHWFRPGIEKSEAVQYWEHTKALRRFNITMARVFAHAQLANQCPFGGSLPDRNIHVHDERERELLTIAKISASAKGIVDVMLERHGSCGGHPTYVHVSADGNDNEEMIIETLMKDCGTGLPRPWYAIQWIQSHTTVSDGSRRTHGICGTLRHRRRRRLCIEIESNEIRHSLVYIGTETEAREPSLRLSDLLSVNQSRTDTGALARWLRKGKSIRVSLGFRIAKSMLYLVGSTLIQTHWKADDLLVPQDVNLLGDGTPLFKVYVDDVSNLDIGTVIVAKHFVLELGALLWELFFLEKVKVLEDDSEYNEDGEPKEEESLYNALARTYLDGTARFLQAICLEIINNCLRAYDDLEEEVAEGEIRANLYDKIVKPLQDFVYTYSETSPSRSTSAYEHKNTLKVPKPVLNMHVNQVLDIGLPVQVACIPSCNDLTSSDMDCVELFTLHRAGVPDADKCKETDDWSHMLKIRNLSYGIGRDSGPKIKVAILDTGIDMNHPLVLGEWYNAGTNEHGRIRGFKDFVQDDNPRDDSGHGTHIAGIILDLSGNTHVYVGRVVKSQKHLKSGHNTFRQRIVEALKHARTEWQVDIISLSFGFSRTDSEDQIREEIRLCQNEGIAVFSSASNDGGHRPRTYPGRYPRVFCIHSATGLGTNSEFNPTPEDSEDNFMCVGEYIQSWWPIPLLVGENDRRDGLKRMSGTSFATPVAISIAVFMIGYIRKKLTNHHWNIVLLSDDGIRAIFKLLSEGNKRGGYGLLSIENLFGKYTEDHIHSLLRHYLDGRIVPVSN